MLNDAPIDGLLLIDKPADITSHDVVHRVRRAIGQKSVGHTGTLDPLATGLMILVLGEATKLSDYLLTADKAYGLKVRLGLTTDTLDRTGKVLTETPCGFLRAQIQAAVDGLTGEFQWPVPLFSAAKIDGKKLYEYGRSGQAVELPVKTMKFWDVVMGEASEASVALTLSCTKGSFVRTWAAQLGSALGVGGIIDELRRLRVGTFKVEDALTLEQLETLSREDVPALGAALVPMAQALPAWKSLLAGPKDARLVANGQVPRDIFNRLIFEQKQAHEQGEPIYVKVISDTGNLLAILAAEPGQGLKIRRVFRSFA